MNKTNDEISLKELIEKGKWFVTFFYQWKVILLAGVNGVGLTYSFIKKTSVHG
jgi:hypothetical protein